MSASQWRKLLSIGAETLVAVGSCLLFYAAFLAVLSVVFPQGTGLRDLIGRAPMSPYGLTEAAHPAVAAGVPDSANAVLTVLNRDVRWKLAGEITWSPAGSGVVLGGGDGVQTSSRGEAQVAFDDANFVRLGGNTLIMIKEPSPRLDSGRRRSSLAVVAGELWAKLPASDNEPMDLNIEAGGARARIRSGSEPAADSRFKITVSPERAPTFAVYGGTADIEAQGKMVRLSANQFTTVDSTGPRAPRTLLPPPSLVAPDADATLAQPEDALGITFRWQPLEGAERYRISLARDAGFERRVLDQVTTRASFTSGPLVPGEYFWRVMAVRAGVDGLASQGRGFRLLRSSAGPGLRVQWSPLVVHAERYQLAGITEPRATILAGGKRVAADANGRFRCTVSLKRGINVVVVEAIDARGSSSYASAVVHAKF